MSTRGIAILGSTGSIGCNTLRVIESLGPERFRIVALGAGRNVARLADQITQHQPELVSVDSEESAQKLKAELTTRNAWLPGSLSAKRAWLKSQLTTGPTTWSLGPWAQSVSSQLCGPWKPESGSRSPIRKRSLWRAS